MKARHPKLPTRVHRCTGDRCARKDRCLRFLSPPNGQQQAWMQPAEPSKCEKLMQSLTASQRRALEIIRDNPRIKPRAFAELMWPDSPCWNKRARCGAYGTSVGGGMATAAGGYLGKLRKLGYLDTWGSRVTDKALEALSE